MMVTARAKGLAKAKRLAEAEAKKQWANNSAPTDYKILDI